MNPIRNKRLSVIRSYMHTFNLDIGAGKYPITNHSVTIDTDINNKPNFVCSVIRMPFPNSYFDSVTALEILEHLTEEELEFALHEINRVLQTNGQLIVSIPNASKFMIIPQRILWNIRSRTTISEYYQNESTHGHIGMMQPERMEDALIYSGFSVKRKFRLMLYDYVFICVKN